MDTTPIDPSHSLHPLSTSSTSSTDAITSLAQQHISRSSTESSHTATMPYKVEPLLTTSSQYPPGFSESIWNSVQNEWPSKQFYLRYLALKAEVDNLKSQTAHLNQNISELQQRQKLQTSSPTGVDISTQTDFSSTFSNRSSMLSTSANINETVTSIISPKVKKTENLTELTTNMYTLDHANLQQFKNEERKTLPNFGKYFPYELIKTTESIGDEDEDEDEESAIESSPARSSSDLKTVVTKVGDKTIKHDIQDPDEIPRIEVSSRTAVEENQILETELEHLSSSIKFAKTVREGFINFDDPQQCMEIIYAARPEDFQEKTKSEQSNIDKYIETLKKLSEKDDQRNSAIEYANKIKQHYNLFRANTMDVNSLEQLPLKPTVENLELVVNSLRSNDLSYSCIQEYCTSLNTLVNQKRSENKTENVDKLEKDINQIKETAKEKYKTKINDLKNAISSALNPYGIFITETVAPPPSYSLDISDEISQENIREASEALQALRIEQVQNSEAFDAIWLASMQNQLQDKLLAIRPISVSNTEFVNAIKNAKNSQEAKNLFLNFLQENNDTTKLLNALAAFAKLNTRIVTQDDFNPIKTELEKSIKGENENKLFQEDCSRIQEAITVRSWLEADEINTNQLQTINDFFQKYPKEALNFKDLIEKTHNKLVESNNFNLMPSYLLAKKDPLKKPENYVSDEDVLKELGDLSSLNTEAAFLEKINEIKEKKIPSFYKRKIIINILKQKQKEKNLQDNTNINQAIYSLTEDAPSQEEQQKQFSLLTTSELTPDAIGPVPILRLPEATTGLQEYGKGYIQYDSKGFFISSENAKRLISILSPQINNANQEKKTQFNELKKKFKDEHLWDEIESNQLYTELIKIFTNFIEPIGYWSSEDNTSISSDLQKLEKIINHSSDAVIKKKLIKMKENLELIQMFMKDFVDKIPRPSDKQKIEKLKELITLERFDFISKMYSEINALELEINELDKTKKTPLEKDQKTLQDIRSRSAKTAGWQLTTKDLYKKLSDEFIQELSETRSDSLDFTNIQNEELKTNLTDFITISQESSKKNSTEVAPTATNIEANPSKTTTLKELKKKIGEHISEISIKDAYSNLATLQKNAVAGKYINENFIAIGKTLNQEVSILADVQKLEAKKTGSLEGFEKLEKLYLANRLMSLVTDEDLKTQIEIACGEEIQSKKNSTANNDKKTLIKQTLEDCAFETLSKFTTIKQDQRVHQSRQDSSKLNTAEKKTNYKEDIHVKVQVDGCEIILNKEKDKKAAETLMLCIDVLAGSPDATHRNKALSLKTDLKNNTWFKACIKKWPEILPTVSNKTPITDDAFESYREVHADTNGEATAVLLSYIENVLEEDSPKNLTALYKLLPDPPSGLKKQLLFSIKTFEKTTGEQRVATFLDKLPDFKKDVMNEINNLCNQDYSIENISKALGVCIEKYTAATLDICEEINPKYTKPRITIQEVPSSQEIKTNSSRFSLSKNSRKTAPQTPQPPTYRILYPKTS